MEITNSINNEGLALGNTKEFIVLHDTGSNASDQNNVDFLNRSDYISCHYLAGKEKGEIWQLVEDDRIAYHAGVSVWKGKEDLNKYSIGIEVNSYGDVFSDVQRKATKKLITFLMSKYNIPKENVLRHKDIAPNRKIDITDAFWNNEYKSWEDYQNNLKTMTIIDEKTVEVLIAKNSLEWNKTKSLDLQKALEQCNKILRETL